MLQVLEKIRPSCLEEAMLTLPFAKVTLLLRVLDVWARQRWNTPLTCRVLTHLLKVHHNQLTASRGVGAGSTSSSSLATTTTTTSLRPVLSSIGQHLKSSLQLEKDQIGYNVAGVKYLRRMWEQEHISEFVDWEKEVAQMAKQVKQVASLSNTNSVTANAAGGGGKKRRKKSALIKTVVVADA